MPEDNVEAVRRIFDAWAVGDFSGGIADLDPHVTFVVSRAFPENGVFIGPAGVNEYMRIFLEHWDHLTLEATNLQPVGDTVLADAVQGGAGRASGAQTDLSYYMLFTFRGGKIVRIETVLDRAEALEAAGLSE